MILKSNSIFFPKSIILFETYLSLELRLDFILLLDHGATGEFFEINAWIVKFGWFSLYRYFRLFWCFIFFILVFRFVFLWWRCSGDLRWLLFVFHIVTNLVQFDVNWVTRFHIDSTFLGRWLLFRCRRFDGLPEVLQWPAVFVFNFTWYRFWFWILIERIKKPINYKFHVNAILKYKANSP